jgi:hypothetical protein
MFRSGFLLDLFLLSEDGGYIFFLKIFLAYYTVFVPEDTVLD